MADSLTSVWNYRLNNLTVILLSNAMPYCSMWLHVVHRENLAFFAFSCIGRLQSRYLVVRTVMIPWIVPTEPSRSGSEVCVCVCVHLVLHFQDMPWVKTQQFLGVFNSRKTNTLKSTTKAFLRVLPRTPKMSMPPSSSVGVNSKMIF